MCVPTKDAFEDLFLTRTNGVKLCNIKHKRFAISRIKKKNFNKASQINNKMSQKVAFVVVFKNDLVNILQLYFKNNLQMSILFFFLNTECMLSLLRISSGHSLLLV